MKMKMTDAYSGFSIDFSRMNITWEQLDALQDKFQRAAQEMAALEAGAIKNPDENRKVTHFTDRAVYRSSELFKAVESFAADVREGRIVSGTGKTFDAVVVNGIGGSALGPQLLQFAINGPYWNEKNQTERRNGLKVYFLDNTDSAGLNDLKDIIELDRTLQLCVSKSGGTQETLNNLTALENAYAQAGLDYSQYACAITMQDSKLDKHAKSHNWLKVFPMAESIGGRTSETSIVGHLPAALSGIDFGMFLDGACRMDIWTRNRTYRDNPASMLAAMWYLAGNGKGDRNMVIVPYSDRLVLLSRYLQQLVMESLGKELDLDGQTVHQGLNVFGNKGGTDAHAFIQQLNDGRDDFFATFIEVLHDAEDIPLDNGRSMGDYLHGFLYGLAAALESKKRPVITMEITTVSPANLGALIALYERAVAIYAEFININAFHQPGVQAYKLAAKGMLEVREQLFDNLKERPVSGTAAELAARVGLEDKEAVVAGWLNRAAVNPASYNVERKYSPDANDWVYTVK
ncbi:MAG: glucose-6-phosphate isomerase [Lentisphaerae bacterium]|nr:glucose-6-phosphate isomerase [Lentisphaerota bacterium]